MPVGPGRGLQVPSGPQRYAEAARTFEELLLQDGGYAEAATQLEACQALLQVRPPFPTPYPLPPVLLWPPRLTPVPSQQCGRPGGVPVSPFLLKAKEPLFLPGKGQGWVVWGDLGALPVSPVGAEPLWPLGSGMGDQELPGHR